MENAAHFCEVVALKFLHRVWRLAGPSAFLEDWRVWPIVTGITPAPFLAVPSTFEEGRYKPALKREFQRPWCKAGLLNHLDDQDQHAVSNEVSLSAVPGIWHNSGRRARLVHLWRDRSDLGRPRRVHSRPFVGVFKSRFLNIFQETGALLGQKLTKAHQWLQERP